LPAPARQWTYLVVALYGRDARTSSASGVVGIVYRRNPLSGFLAAGVGADLLMQHHLDTSHVTGRAC